MINFRNHVLNKQDFDISQGVETEILDQSKDFNLFSVSTIRTSGLGQLNDCRGHLTFLVLTSSLNNMRCCLRSFTVLIFYQFGP